MPMGVHCHQLPTAESRVASTGEVVLRLERQGKHVNRVRRSYSLPRGPLTNTLAFPGICLGSVAIRFHHRLFDGVQYLVSPVNSVPCLTRDLAQNGSILQAADVTARGGIIHA